MITVLAATSSPAFAYPAIGPCPLAASVNFSPPGLSVNGAVSASSTSTTTTSGAVISGCGTSSLPTQTITTKSTKCAKKAGSPVPECTPGSYYDDTYTQFELSGSASLKKSLKTVSLTLDGMAVTLHTKSVAAVVLGAPCPGEFGFQMTGKVVSAGIYKAAASTVVACLGSDSGPGTSGSFATDLGGACATCTIASAQLDPTDSYVKLGVPKSHGKTTCTSLTGTQTGTAVVSGCTGKGSSDAGGGSATANALALATGGTITWANGEQTTISAPVIVTKPGKKCSGYSKTAVNNPSLDKVSGIVTADSHGLKVPGKFKIEVCVLTNGAIYNIGPIKIT